MKKILLILLCAFTLSAFAQKLPRRVIPYQVQHYTDSFKVTLSQYSLINCVDSSAIYIILANAGANGSLATVSNVAIAGGGGGGTPYVPGSDTNYVATTGDNLYGTFNLYGNLTANKYVAADSFRLNNLCPKDSGYIDIHNHSNSSMLTFSDGIRHLGSINTYYGTWKGIDITAGAQYKSGAWYRTLAHNPIRSYQNLITGKIEYYFGGWGNIGSAITWGSSKISLDSTGSGTFTGDVTVEDSIRNTSLTANTIVGTSSTKALTSYSVVDLSTLGLQTKPEWEQVSGTYFSTSSFVMTGATYNEPNKYNRALVKILSKRVSATINSTASDYLAIATHGQDTGFIVRFISGTLPTVSGTPALALNRPYFIVSKTNDSLKISERPSGTAINFTTTGSNLKVVFQKQAYVSNITTSADGTIDTISVASSAALASTDSLFYISKTRKIYDYQEYSYTGGVEVIADASNSQGRRILDVKQPMYAFSVNSALGTAGTTCTWNVYRKHDTWTAAMFTSAPAMATATTLNAQRPDQAKQYIKQGGSISFRVTAVAGSPAFLQWQIYLVPVMLYAQD